MDMINADDLQYEYISTDDGGIVSRLKAVAGISLNVKKGEFVAVLGHNGSGKSTLAKMLNALLIPTGGVLWVNGYDVKNQEFLWDIRQSTGYVFQNPDNQIIATIVEDDVAFGPENLGVEPNEIRKRVDEALSVVRMSEYAKRAPHQLSGGQKQRVAIAGVLAMKPACIVLDEPTAMLDPSGRKEVMDTVMKLNKEDKITVVHITHYMEETVNADRVIVMEKGRIIMCGTPKEIFVQVDKLREIGLDVPQVTLLSNKLRKRGIDIAADVLTVDEMVGEICRLKSKI